MSCRHNLVLSLVVVVGILLFLASSATTAAQNATGSVEGTVTDSSGAAVPSTVITATDTGGVSRTAVSNSGGDFSLTGLPAGKYTVTAISKRFTPYQNENVEVAENRVSRLAIVLKIEGQQQQITVTAEDQSMLDVAPANNASSVVIGGEELAALPDDPDDLQSDLTALAGPGAGPNGAQMYIDGFTAGQLPPKSAIQEIRINQNPFSAQYDTAGYQRVEIFTRPGADRWHGLLLAFGDDPSFNSRDPFATGQSGFSSVQAEVDTTGPLNKSATLSLYGEYRKIDDTAVVDAIGLNSSLQPTSVSQSLPNGKTRLNFVPKLDYQLTKSNTLSVRYQYYRDQENNQGVGLSALASQAYDLTTQEHTLQIRDTQVINKKIINETRLQFLGDLGDQIPLSTAPTISVLGALEAGGSPTGTIIDRTNHYELQNYTSIVLAKHSVIFGGRLRIATDANRSNGGENGTFTFDSINSYASAAQGTGGAPIQFTITAPIPEVKVTSADGALYAEDTWRLRQGMTFDYGLRFETQNHISDHADWAPRLGFAWAVGQSKSAPKTVLRAGFGIFYDRFQLAQILEASRINDMPGTGGPRVQYVANDPGFFPLIPPTADLPQALPSFYQIAPHLHAPFNAQTGVSVERQLSKSTRLSVSYLHSAGYDQLVSNNVNAPEPGTCNPSVAPDCVLDGALRPNGVAEDIYQFESAGIFRQNQLITNFTVRRGKQLSLNGYYVLNYAESDTAGVTSFASNPYDLLQDYGRASFDVRQRGYLDGIVNLPYAVSLSPFLLVNSGTPYNVTLPEDLIGSSQFNQRPTFASSLSNPANVIVTKFGAFDLQPVPGETLVPINYLTGPHQLTFNLRISKSLSFGAIDGNEGSQSTTESAGSSQPGRSPRPEAYRYKVTFSVFVRNLFNDVNLAPPVGVLQSQFFGQSVGLAGGAFSGSAANRQFYLQTVFGF